MCKCNLREKGKFSTIPLSEHLKPGKQPRQLK